MMLSCQEERPATDILPVQIRLEPRTCFLSMIHSMGLAVGSSRRVRCSTSVKWRPPHCDVSPLIPFPTIYGGARKNEFRLSTAEPVTAGEGRFFPCWSTTLSAAIREEHTAIQRSLNQGETLLEMALVVLSIYGRGFTGC